MNCKPGELAMVVRNTRRMSCIENVIGSPVTVTESFRLVDGAPFWLYQGLLCCPNCGTPLFGLLDADLQPLRPRPAAAKPTSVEQPSGSEVLTA